MLFETKRNQFGYTQFLCPFCGDWKPERVKSMHIAYKARHEEKKKVLDPTIPTRHLDFYLANTKEEIVTRRVWLIKI